MSSQRGPLGPLTLRLWPWPVAFVSSFTFMSLGGSSSQLYYTLLAFIILSLAYSRFRGLFGPENKSMSVTVKWGRERFVFP